MTIARFLACVLTCLVAIPTKPVLAQQIFAGVPQQTLNDGFNERVGVGFGFSARNWFFNQGGFHSAIPPFGGFDPASQANFGFGGIGPNGGFRLNFALGEGSARSNVMQSPGIVVPNGGFGSISDFSQRPFVTGLIPVLGGRDNSRLHNAIEQLRYRRMLEKTTSSGGLPKTSSSESFAGGESRDKTEGLPVEAALAGGGGGPAGSTAAGGDMSVAEIRERQRSADAAAEREIASLVQRGQRVEQQGKPELARVYYQQAARRASGERRRELLERIAALEE